MEHISQPLSDRQHLVSAFSVEADLYETTLIVRVRGELDIATAGLVGAAIGGRDGEYDTVDFDLHDLTFVDVTGLRSILAATTALDGKAKIAVGSRLVDRLASLLDIELPLKTAGG